MLNCFYWYAIIWTGVLILYLLNYSSFTVPLAPELVWFFVVTISISLLLGLIFRHKFRFFYNDNIKNNPPAFSFLLGLLFGVLIDFLYARQIPLLAIAIQKTSSYKEFHGIPLFHVLLTCLLTYYGVYSFYYGLCEKRYRKKCLIYFAIVQLVFLLYYLRSQVIFSLFCVAIILIEYLRSHHYIRFWHVLISFLVLLLILFLFGVLGNIRSGYAWDDNSYIDRLGMYTNWPSLLPGQFKWAYSYLVTPMANLNLNMSSENVDYSFIRFFQMLFPQTISKRILFAAETNSDVLLVKGYFTATTGFADVYCSAGLVGLFLYYIDLVFITFLGIKLSSYQNTVNKQTVFLSIMCLTYVFVFFTNTLYFTGISIVLWISIFAMGINKIHFRI